MLRPAMATRVAAGLLALALVGCAPEPGTEGPGSGEFTSETDQGESWPERTPVEEAPKNTEPPETFPFDGAFLPEGAQIDDVGERSATEWFVVLRAEDTAAASMLLDEIIASGSYTVTDEGSTSEGERYATFEGNGRVIDALIIAGDADTEALLSLDILQAE